MLYRVRSAFQRRSHVENLKYLAQAFWIYVRSREKNCRGHVTYAPRTLWRKLLTYPVGIPYVKLRTKFEVSSSNIFEDIFDRLPENLGVTWPKPPLLGKIICAPALLSQDEAIKNEDPSSSSFEDMFDRMPKIMGVTWSKPRPLWKKLFMRPLGFQNAKLYLPNLKSLAQLVLKILSIVCQNFSGPR